MNIRKIYTITCMYKDEDGNNYFLMDYTAKKLPKERSIVKKKGKKFKILDLNPTKAYNFIANIEML